MKIGTSQIDITPKPGADLSGFAARVQPSTGVLDPLFAKAVYLVDGGQKLLWLHCDLVGFDREIVLGFRRWAAAKLGLGVDQVMLSATHTHSGGCTIHLTEAGTYDPNYVGFLEDRLHEAAEGAVAKTEPCELVTVEGHLDLAVDRRKKATSHTDPRVAGIGFRRKDGTFAAAVVNYPMHAVALGSSNRQISADFPGRTAVALSAELPGKPIVLVTNGACANLNPPAENVTVAQLETWGKQVADAVAPLLNKASPNAAATLDLASRVIPLPLDTLDGKGIEAFANKSLQDQKSLAEWGDKYRRAVEHWRTTLLDAVKQGQAVTHRDAELFAVRFGDVLLLGVNAELFSEFADWLRCQSGCRVYIVGYANGDMGYLPTQAAYAEGGYEVDVAHLFYGGFRPKAGGLEWLASQSVELTKKVFRERANPETG